VERVRPGARSDHNRRVLPGTATLARPSALPPATERPVAVPGWPAGRSVAGTPVNRAGDSPARQGMRGFCVLSLVRYWDN